MLRIDGKVPACHQNTNFDSCTTRLLKTAIKYSLEKPMLLNFVDLFTIFCPWL